MAQSQAEPTILAPLRRPAFRALWLASGISGVGTLAHQVGAAWLMAQLAPDRPLLVALLWTATSLPACLLALPAGALADVWDRRRLLLGAQSTMLAVATAAAVLAWRGWLGPWELLALTCALGVGSALSAPALQALLPDLVPRAEVQAAVAAHNAGFNLARTLGPAFGGALVALAGAQAAFAANAASFVGLLAVLRRLPGLPRVGTLPPEPVLPALRGGLRYVRHAPGLHPVLVRDLLFAGCASGLWALLPLVARDRLGLGAGGYGLLLGCLGLGAVAGAALLPRLRGRWATDRTTRGAALAYALATLLPAWRPEPLLVAAGLVVAGGAWLIVLSALGASVQTSAPAWVRGRALGVHLLVVHAGIAAGSATWGAVAARHGTSWALTAAAGLLVATLLATLRLAIAEAGTGEVEARPEGSGSVARGLHLPDAGPVAVSVEYRVALEDLPAFRDAMRDVRQLRLRGGARRWALWRDAAEPERLVEAFVVASWHEHLRQHERLTLADVAAERRARAFHQGPEAPRVQHLVAAGLVVDGELHP